MISMAQRIFKIFTSPDGKLVCPKPERKDRETKLRDITSKYGIKTRDDFFDALRNPNVCIYFYYDNNIPQEISDEDLFVLVSCASHIDDNCINIRAVEENNNQFILSARFLMGWAEYTFQEMKKQGDKK